MRILRLDLLAFGPFTNQSLEFGDLSGLHIVHGPNEAGKSSSLRALRNLLYGIPQQTPDNFVHPYQNLRIGGVLEAADGMRLEFIRRKGRSKTLRGPDDAGVFDESRLIRLLGGVDEATFKQRFGIDYEELSRGESAVCGGAQLAEILFAAGAGMANLRQIQQRLETEADSLFKPRGSNQRIAQSLSDLEKARREIREAQLPTSQWLEHDNALRQAEKRQREIGKELAENRVEHSRLDRVLRSLPLIGQLKPLRERLAGLAEAPLLPEPFSADRREAETNVANAVREEARAGQEVERLENELRGVEVPVELLEDRTAIAQLHSDLGSYQKAATDRPGLVAERNAAQKRVREILEDLGRPLGLKEAESLRLPKVQRKRIQELGVQSQALIEKQQFSDEAVEELDDEIQRLQDDLGQLPPERESSDLERTIRSVQNKGDLDAQQMKADSELQHLRVQANVELARLCLFEGTLDDLERLPVPSVETIERIESELVDADLDVHRWNEKVEELTTTTQALQRDLDALRLEGEVPAEADLASARQRRDAGWQLVRRAWRDNSFTDEPAAAAFIDEFPASSDLATAFRASMDTADALADRLRRESIRVARKAKLTADLQQTNSSLTGSQKQLEEAEQCRQGVWNRWQAQWEPAGIEPLTPREMRSWRTTQQQLAGIAADIRKRDVDREGLVKQIDSLRANLNQCLDALDQPRIPDEEPLAAVLDRCQQITEQIRSDNEQRDRLAGEQKRLRGQRPEGKRRADAAREQLDDWRTDWAKAVAALGLQAEASPSEANAVIEAVDELLKLLDSSRKLDERITGIDTDAQKFEESVRQLLEQVAPDLLDTFKKSVGRAVANLVDRLRRAEMDQTKVDGLQEQLRSQRNNQDEAASNITRWQGALAKLCEQAGCRSPDDLPQAEERSRTRWETETKLETLEQRLCELAAGTTLDEWIATAEQFDSDQVQAKLTSLNEKIVNLEETRNEVSKAIGRHGNELFRMDGSGKAAEAQIHAEHVLASIRSDVEEYIRRRLALAVLSRAMERFRETSQGPVLARAAEVFSTLTLGSFSGLRADYDDAGNGVLVGVRPGGQSVALAGMSDGTCDQLYLALRVALLEWSLDGQEPLPFIVDDILIMFDDDRAAAALKVLAQLSEKTQVVFFTHHEHLVEIAREALDSRVLCVHRLNASAMPLSVTARNKHLACIIPVE